MTQSNGLLAWVQAPPAWRPVRDKTNKQRPPALQFVCFFFSFLPKSRQKVFSSWSRSPPPSPLASRHPLQSLTLRPACTERSPLISSSIFPVRSPQHSSQMCKQLGKHVYWPAMFSPVASFN